MSRERLYYEQDGVKVRKLAINDSFELKEEDKKEIFLVGLNDCTKALKRSIELTDDGFTVLINEKPEICFGVSYRTFFSPYAVIWMLSSEKLNDISKRFVRHSREYIDYFLMFHGKLFNYVHCMNTSSIRWLKYLGARFDDPQPYGLHNAPFMRFEFNG